MRLICVASVTIRPAPALRVIIRRKFRRNIGRVIGTAAREGRHDDPVRNYYFSELGWGEQCFMIHSELHLNLNAVDDYVRDMGIRRAFRVPLE
jgi:hypothetical protein